LTDVILIVCCIYFCGTDIWRFLNSRKGYVRIRWIQKSGVDAVKLYNVQYSRAKRLFLPELLLRILIAVLLIPLVNLYLRYLKTEYWPLTVCVLLLLTSTLVNLYLVLLRRKYGEFAYLTNSSLATMDGDLKKENCRFVLDMEIQNADRGDKYLNVYRGKSEVPWRYKLIEKEEEAVRIIHEFYI